MVVSPAPGAERAAGASEPAPSEGAPRSLRGQWRVVGVCLAVLAAPLVVALIGFRRSAWTPVLDLAMTELRVRDVGGRHTPLIGLPGRIGTLAEQGSHPGPLSFYALAPTYRLLGATSWALQVATVIVHVVAMGVALAIAARRGGRALVVVTATALALLTAGYGGGALSEPWNPYLPLLWWVVVLLAVWSVLCGDVALLPVVVLAGSFCAQTHVPYLGLALGMGALAAGGAVVHWARVPARRPAVVRWALLALGVGLVLWAPPTLDQLRREPGNYELLIDHFSDPPEEPKGVADGVEVGLRYLDLSHLVRGDVTDPGWLVTSADGNRPTSAKGSVLLVAWVAAAVVALRRRRAPLLRVHLVVAAGLGLMVLAISRIFGVVWYYLTLWGWAVGLLALVATVWTLLDAFASRIPEGRRQELVRRGVVSMAVVAVLVVARFGVDAWSSTHADASVASELAAVIEPTSDALFDGVGAAEAGGGRYLVTWDDAFHIGSQGYGLLNELERRGHDVGIESGRRAPGTLHRVLEPSDATARVHLATGVHVDRWRRLVSAVEVATFDPRSADGRAEQARLRDEVLDTLADLGLDDLIPKVDDNLFGAAIDERVPERTQLQMGRMLELGAPMAIFVVPVTASAP